MTTSRVPHRSSWISTPWWRLLLVVLLSSSRSGSYVAPHNPARHAIVGGIPVTEGAYPFLAFSAGSELCGATLIWPDILLSAGHCASAFPVGSGVWIGGIRLSGAGSAYHEIAQVLVHPDYPVAATQPHDILLLQIASRSWQTPVTLATDASLPAEGFSVRVLGYGNTEYGAISQFAKQVDVAVVNGTACDALYGGKLILETQFCTDGNGDSCQGDSGGPLLNANGAQVGIVSFGEGCDEYPSVNTRVSSYSDWIQQGICRLSSSPPSDCASIGAAPTTPAPMAAPTSTPTFPPIPLVTGEPIGTAPPVVATNTPVTGVPITTAAPIRSEPPSDRPSAGPSMLPTVAAPTTVPPVANNTSPTPLLESSEPPPTLAPFVVVANPPASPSTSSSAASSPSVPQGGGGGGGVLLRSLTGAVAGWGISHYMLQL